ncbi:Flp family type IVb pilin [Mesorhizobium sp. ANAO-SY3R2]|uniref:Flp family type IVb pilin n=1 Tax=Mesorhizobium sp. ANAO-SY3R2 TaxID=3166644 RepID=UPI00366F3C19
MSNLIARFVKDESGATAIEYGLIAALIAVAIIVGAGQLGGALDQKFKDVAKTVTDSGKAGGTPPVTPAQ